MSLPTRSPLTASLSLPVGKNLPPIGKLPTLGTPGPILNRTLPIKLGQSTLNRIMIQSDTMSNEMKDGEENRGGQVTIMERKEETNASQSVQLTMLPLPITEEEAEKIRTHQAKENKEMVKENKGISLLLVCNYCRCT